MAIQKLMHCQKVASHRQIFGYHLNNITIQRGMLFLSYSDWFYYISLWERPEYFIPCSDYKWTQMTNKILIYRAVIAIIMGCIQASPTS